MSYVRQEFPTCSITPKLHMLEDHMIPFIKRWRTGAGIYGEQGIESLHNEFNKLDPRFASLKPAEYKLKQILGNHVTGRNEIFQKLAIYPKKRKNEDESEE